MSPDVPLPPPFGRPAGPSCTTEELLARYLDGAGAGSSPQARVEGCVLSAGDEPVAIRLEGAVLVRDELAAEAASVRAGLHEALRAGCMEPVEEDTPLAGIVEIEVVGRRGDAWSLWAADPDRGRRILAARAAGDMPGLLEAEAARRAEEAETDATLSRLEREL